MRSQVGRSAGRWRSELPGYALIAAAIGLVGLGLIATVAYTPALRGKPFGDLLQSLGEAAVAGAVLGALLDYSARNRFARDVGRDVFLTLFSGNAPAEYVRQLESLCRANALSHRVETHIEATWAEYQVLLKLDIRTRGTIENISAWPLPATNSWIMGSAPGSPGSRIYLYEATHLGKDRSGRSTEIARVSMDAEQLSALERLQPDGSKSIAFERNGNYPALPPGGLSSTAQFGVTYHRSTGTLPLLHKYPMLRFQLVLSGAALSDLSIEVRRGMDVLEREVVGDGCTPTELYKVTDLTMGGTATILQWQLRE